MKRCQRTHGFAAIVGISLLGLALLMSGCAGDGDDVWPPAFTLVTSISIDGGTSEADEPRGITLDASGNIYVTGYVTQSGNKNVWLAKYDANLVLQESTTLDGPANGEDEGYGIALDGTGYLYVVGYVTEQGQDHNIWLAKYDTDLVFQKQITVNGSANSTDDGYGIIFDGIALYCAGTVTETGEGYNIWIARYDTDLILQKSTTLNGPANNTDKGRFLVLDGGGAFLSAAQSRKWPRVMTSGLENLIQTSNSWTRRLSQAQPPKRTKATEFFSMAVKRSTSRARSQNLAKATTSGLPSMIQISTRSGALL